MCVRVSMAWRKDVRVACWFVLCSQVLPVGKKKNYQVDRKDLVSSECLFKQISNLIETPFNT